MYSVMKDNRKNVLDEMSMISREIYDGYSFIRNVVGCRGMCFF